MFQPKFTSLIPSLLLVAATGTSAWSQFQLPEVRYGNRVPAEVQQIYDRGLQYLAQAQGEDGSWGGTGRGAHGARGAGVTGMCVMVFLSNGEDPDYGKYSVNIRRALRHMIMSQDPRTGYLPASMYHHGFAMLGLSEAYGVVNDSALWDGSENNRQRRTIGEALELGVRCAVTSQKNNRWGGWRYSPTDTTADTSVSGAVLMGLLAARNAGIEVPDATIEKALGYFRRSTSDKGMVAYSGGVGGFGTSMNRSSIGTLVYAIGKKKDWTEYKATLEHITSRLDHNEQGYPFYFRYYMAQALFQGDYEAWEKWNEQLIEELKELQRDDGSFTGNHGPAYATSMSLLSLALNYRLLPIYER